MTFRAVKDPELTISIPRRHGFRVALILLLATLDAYRRRVPHIDLTVTG